MMKLLRHAHITVGLLACLQASTEGWPALAAVRWGTAALEQETEWYASVEARTAADTLLLYQSTQGAWPKNTDLFKPASPETLAGIQSGGEANTIDNGATTSPMRFLAKVIEVTHETRYKDSFARGLDYLIEAQYPNGGWPQFYPLRPKGYYSHITFNDGAMINVMDLLRDVVAGNPPCDFVDATRRVRAAAAVARGTDCILRLQIRQRGKLTAWCAQYEETTLEPAWARAYEPPSLSGAESVGIVRFLMAVEQPTPEIAAAIEGAIEWFQTVTIKGMRLESFRGEDGRRDRHLVPDPDAPPLWARFYELGTHRPLYLDRDSVVHYNFADITPERRNGYAYHGTWAADLITKDYPRWKARHASRTDPSDREAAPDRS